MTISQLKMLATETPLLLQLKLLDYTDYNQFDELVNSGINYIFTQLSRHPEQHHEKTENQLTVDVVDRLCCMGFKASFDTSNGGHCDVLVQGKFEHQWIGEAKITTGYAWVTKGFLQLDTRYSSGDPNSTCCGMLLYCRRENVPEFMDEWKIKLEGMDYDFAFQDCGKMPNAFYSRHLHEKTGVQMNVRHIPLALSFDPKDK